ncbi:MAG TPA: phosphatase PAP2 family protein [Smithella sp.]|nr:phosphatase PAP2 family protein [Smithella sp.]
MKNNQPSRLLKNAHLLRCAANRPAQRISIYASRFSFLRALHLNIFEQPSNAGFFRNHKGVNILIICLMMTVLSYFFWDIPLARYCRQLNLSVINIFDIITRLGLSTWYIVASIILYIFFRYIYKNYLNASRALFVFLSVSISGILVDVVKWIAGRYRPIELFNHGYFGFKFFDVGYEWTSFPSGHAQTAFALATAATILKPRLGIPLFVIAGVVGISRIILNAHYLSDVIAGAGIGILLTLVIKYFFDLKQIELAEK